MMAVLWSGIFFVSAACAQTEERTVQDRVLFIFDTSSDMKPRVDAMQKELDTLLATSLSEQLHAGDSIGVWTINQTLHPGDYPLQTWDPDQAAKIASTLTQFVGKQHYSKTTHFEALQPLLNRVVKDSERLTILIFCDGDTKMAGTPYDASINEIFDQKKAEQKKARQPFIVMLRSQRGQFIGGSVNLSPMPLTFPRFPPLPVPPSPTPPAPPKTTNTMTNLPPSVPTVSAPPLIIVGTNVSRSMKMLTNPPVAIPAATPESEPVKPTPVPTPTETVTPAPATPAPQTNEPASPEPVTPTNVSEPLPAAAPTNPVTNEMMAMPPTNPPAPAPAPPMPASSGKKIFLIIGAGLLIVAIGLGLFLWRRSRAASNSLITRSMRKP